jgi:hypothetical protein
MRRVLVLLAIIPALCFPALSQTVLNPEPVNRADNLPTPDDNGRIVAMSKMGLEDSIIVARIEASTWTFKLSDADIITLRKDGVSSRVVAAMVDSSVANIAKVTVDDQPVQIETMGQAKTAGRVVNNLSGDLTPLKENAFLEGPVATTSASPMPKITIRLPKGDSIGNYILVKLNEKDDRRELEVGSGTGASGNRNGLASSAAVRPVKVIAQGDSTFQLLPANHLPAGQYMVYVVGSSDEQRDIYGKGYDFSVLR